MAIAPRQLRRWIDSPIMPGRLARVRQGSGRVDLLLTPHAESTAAKLADAVRAQLERLPADRDTGLAVLVESRQPVIDSGIDATHPALQLRDTQPADDSLQARVKNSRVYETYDFTRLRGLFDRAPGDNRVSTPEEQRVDELAVWLNRGRSIDWAAFEPHLKVDYSDADDIPKHECPDLGLLDLRGIRPDGTGDEFALLAAP